MNPNNIINVDHINIIRENKGRVRFESIVIPKDIDLLSELAAMVENPNRTVLDMQNRMSLFFNIYNRQDYNYIYPYDYANSRMQGPTYPKEMSLEEYSNLEANIKKDLNTKHHSYHVYTQKLSEAIRKTKMDYLDSARRYIEAFRFYKEVDSLNSDKSVKMHSTETIGWSGFSFDITNDVKIKVDSNFGYGWSSYFFVSLTYKDIDILPYSYWVRYYNADMASLTRCTRNYEPTRNSWNMVFKFVESVTNKAIDNERAFVKEFILNEVEEMMRGLRAIMLRPIDYLSKSYEARFNKPESNVIGIWHSSDDFGADYNVYKSELAMAVMAEKITGAIDFLKNLKQFAEILPQLNNSIDEIKRMSIDILSDIKQSIAKIQDEINRRTLEVNTKGAEYELLQAERKTHENNIDMLFEDAKKAQLDASGGTTVNIWRSTYEKEYREKNEEYDRLCKRQDDLSKEMSKMRIDISKRAHFLHRLENCVAIVESNNPQGTI